MPDVRISKRQALRDALADVEEKCENFDSGARADYHADKLPATISAALERAAVAGRGEVRRALLMLGATPANEGAADDNTLRSACIAALGNSLQRAVRATPPPARGGAPCPRCSAVSLSNV